MSAKHGSHITRLETHVEETARRQLSMLQKQERMLIRLAGGCEAPEIAEAAAGAADQPDSPLSVLPRRRPGEDDLWRYSGARHRIALQCYEDCRC